MLDPNVAELAEKLGQAMANSKAAKDYRQARQAADADPEAQAQLKAYQEHLELLARKQQENRPIEVEDKHKLRALREKLAGNEKLKALMAVEVDYRDMTLQVTDILGKHLISSEGGQKPTA